MAFSRWFNNTFYTYHQATNATKKIQETFACAIDPIFVDGEYVEHTIQYGSLKKETLREEFLEKCCQYFTEDWEKIVEKENLNKLIDRFIEGVDEDYEENGRK